MSLLRKVVNTTAQLARKLAGDAAEDQSTERQTEELQRVGVTSELLEFLDSVSTEHQSTFSQFPLDDAALAEADRFEMTDEEEEHARAVLRASPAFRRMRRHLCPTMLPERRFWFVYFALTQRFRAGAAARPRVQPRAALMRAGEAPVLREGESAAVVLAELSASAAATAGGSSSSASASSLPHAGASGASSEQQLLSLSASMSGVPIVVTDASAGVGVGGAASNADDDWERIIASANTAGALDDQEALAAGLAAEQFFDDIGNHAAS